ncbi:polysaccharide export protein [Sphingomonas donggukensis]|uniref:Polysaccharide export protein n=1 Tax=Sphingomonas donggukensis TaxID=2949093 RepID=A0ABY4TPY1_9SPHN|nr:polysaccharide biosynthesis/export family protein [Sphingomonas donggukensis]URW74441.1 polysaccharide export protein [Sphingomonas donggukensis]
MRSLVLPASLALVLTGCGGSNFRPEQAGAVTAGETLPAPLVSDLREVGEYRLGPTDKIAIRVFGVPELSGDTQIEADGTVAVSLIGNVPASGETTQSLARTIQNRLGARYLRDPNVTVSIIEAQSQRVTLDGAVKTPGRYPIVGRTSLTEALALGQGLSDYGKASEVVVFRTVGGKRYAARFDLKAIRGGRLADPEIYGNDIVVVGTDAVRLALRDVASAAPILGLFYLIR